MLTVYFFKHLMDSNWLWMCCFIVICLAELPTAKKYKRSKYNNSYEILSEAHRSIDLRGTLRRDFFLNCALEDPSKNSVASPLSALMPLAKLALGAVDTSLNQLLLSIGVLKDEINRHFKRLIAEMRFLPGGRLCMVSKFYIAAGLRLKSAYRRPIQQIFKLNTESVNFHLPEETAEIINSWVSKNTAGKINEIIGPSDISSNTQLLIVNAIHFKAKWKTPFERNKDFQFHAPSGSKSVRSMRVTENLNYTDDATLRAKIIKVPYAGGKAYFLIVLPNHDNDLNKLLKELKSTPELLDSAMSLTTRRSITLTMPTFKIETEINLKKIYQEIGVKQIFEIESGLDEMMKDATVLVSSAKQKAFIKVYEEGTEAAAASVIGMTKTSYMKSTRVNVDRPFLFMIISENQQLFTGVVTDPAD